MTDVDDLVRIIDKRTAAAGEKWDVYRCQTGEWAVSLSDPRYQPDPSRRTIRNKSLTAALQAASESARLPVVPLRPQRYDPTAFAAAKSPYGGWNLTYAGQKFTGFPRPKTRRETLEMGATYCAHANKQADQWDRQWGQLVASGTENIDYRWDNQ